ncbi:MAG: DUF4390 domain-containing protein [bacterium]|nr:DUF4390 domain-containing protein [bacterium]
MRTWALTIGLLLTMSLLSPVVRAGEPDLEFGLYLKDDSVTAWVDLAPLLNSVWIEQLADGLDYTVSCKFELLRPRRLWGNAQVGSAITSFQISYSRLSGEFRIRRFDPDRPVEHRLSSQAELHKWLADSVSAGLGVTDSLQTDRKHLLSIRVETISGSLASLAEEGDSGTDSPIRYLFDKFLDISGLGRESYEIRSTPFHLSDLSER